MQYTYQEETRDHESIVWCVWTGSELDLLEEATHLALAMSRTVTGEAAAETSDHQQIHTSDLS